MAERTTALYRDPDTGRTSYIGIESVYTVVDGRQINIPEKIEELRRKSRAHALFCPCGCGSRLILVAGDRNLREQHFRIHEKGNLPCRAVLEGDLSISSRIALKCWLDETLGSPDLQTRVPIRTVDGTDRKYEFSLLCPERKTAVSYSCKRENLSDEKIRVLEGNRQGIRTFYVVDSGNGGCEGQYPEWMMKIQKVQGYCLLLHAGDLSYKSMELEAVFYRQDLDGAWRQISAVRGALADFRIDRENQLLAFGHGVEDMISMAEGLFLRDQEKIRAARLLEEKRRQRERERALEEKRKREEELRRRREALQREREEAYRRVQEEERERQEKERAAIEALLDQQETVATDAEGRRWVRCEICGRAATDDAFSTYGGRGRANLGICRDCRDQIPDKIPPEKMRRPDISPGKRMAGDGTCPLCGRALVKRNGRFGIFYGCSGYPACRFTKKA